MKLIKQVKNHVNQISHLYLQNVLKEKKNKNNNNKLYCISNNLCDIHNQILYVSIDSITTRVLKINNNK